MKKMMVLAAVALMAIASQAATTKWSSTAVSYNGTKLGGQSVQLYIVGVGGAEDQLFDTRTTASAPAAKKGQIASGTDAGQAGYDYSSTVAGGALWDSDAGDLGRQYYMVITYVDGDTTYTYTSSAVASSGLSDSALGSVAFTFNDTISTVEGTKDAWVAQSVPEPTSGLLMLLGMAGLALRRRRA